MGRTPEPGIRDRLPKYSKIKPRGTTEPLALHSKEWKLEQAKLKAQAKTALFRRLEQGCLDGVMAHSESFRQEKWLATSERMLEAFARFGRLHLRRVVKNRLTFIGRVMHIGRETIEVHGVAKAMSDIPDKFDGFPVRKVVVALERKKKKK